MLRELFGPSFMAQQPCAHAHGHSLRLRRDSQFLAMREVQRRGTVAGKALFYSPDEAAMLPFAGIWVQTLGGHYVERSPSSYDSVVAQYSVESYGDVLGLSRLHCNCAIDGQLVRDATYVRWVQDETKNWYAVCHMKDSIKNTESSQVGCGMRVPLDYYVIPRRGQMNTAAVPPQCAWRIDNTHPAFAVTRTRSDFAVLVPGCPSAWKARRRAVIHAALSTPSSSSSSAVHHGGAPPLPTSDRPAGKRKHPGVVDRENGSESERNEHDAVVRKRRYIMSLFHRGMDEESGLTSAQTSELKCLIKTEHCALCNKYFLRNEFRKHVIIH